MYQTKHGNVPIKKKALIIFSVLKLNKQMHLQSLSEDFVK